MTTDDDGLPRGGPSFSRDSPSKKRKERTADPSWLSGQELPSSRREMLAESIDKARLLPALQ